MHLELTKIQSPKQTRFPTNPACDVIGGCRAGKPAPNEAKDWLGMLDVVGVDSWLRVTDNPYESPAVG